MTTRNHECEMALLCTMASHLTAIPVYKHLGSRYNSQSDMFTVEMNLDGDWFRWVFPNENWHDFKVPCMDDTQIPEGYERVYDPDHEHTADEALRVAIGKVFDGRIL